MQNWGQSGRWRNVFRSDSTSSTKLVSSSLESCFESLCCSGRKRPVEKGPARVPAAGSVPSLPTASLLSPGAGPLLQQLQTQSMQEPRVYVGGGDPPGSLRAGPTTSLSSRAPA